MISKTQNQAREQAENLGEDARHEDEKHKRKVKKLEARIAELEERDARKEGKIIGEAGEIAEIYKKKWEESEEKCRNMAQYIESMKESFAAVFGKDGSSNQGSSHE